MTCPQKELSDIVAECPSQPVVCVPSLPCAWARPTASAFTRYTESNITACDFRTDECSAPDYSQLLYLGNDTSGGSVVLRAFDPITGAELRAIDCGASLSQSFGPPILNSTLRPLVVTLGLGVSGCYGELGTGSTFLSLRGLLPRPNDTTNLWVAVSCPTSSPTTISTELAALATLGAVATATVLGFAVVLLHQTR